MKKVWKSTKPLNYDLNQIHYNYIVKVTNRFKVSDLIDRLPEELWKKVRQYCTGSVDRNHPQEKETLKGKMVV